ncbi:MAG: hypothetical protein GY904_01425 [Planctomycetaceae bacterium]|nr:hypothetical protein [Planctomycetaceae bacterium]
MPTFFEANHDAFAPHQQEPFADSPEPTFTWPTTPDNEQVAAGGPQTDEMASVSDSQTPGSDDSAMTDTGGIEHSERHLAQAEAWLRQERPKTNSDNGLTANLKAETSGESLPAPGAALTENQSGSTTFATPVKTLYRTTEFGPQPIENTVRFAFDSESTERLDQQTKGSQVRQVQNQQPNQETVSDSEEAEAEQLGVPPPKRTSQFVKRNSVLLEPGRYQFEYGIRYSVDTTISPAAGISNTEDSIVQILNATQKRQVFSSPLEFRLGLFENLQGFMSIPIGWSGRSVTAGNSKTDSDTYGLGDLGLGLTRVMWAPEKSKRRILGFVQTSAPTGDGAISLSQQNRNASLGAGYWTLTAGANMSQSMDPIVLFGSLGYTYTFGTRIDTGDRIDVGNTLFYQTGVGYAINPNVTISAAFSGASSGSIRINDQIIPGARTEPFSLRIAGSINSPDKKSKTAASKNYEPFLRYGLTSLANDVEFGIRWTY